MKFPSRSLIVTAAVAAATLSGLSAQTPPPAPAPAPAAPASKPDPAARMQEGVDHRLAHLTKDLALTDAQQTQVKAVLEDEAAQTKALFENQSLSREDKHTQIKALREGDKAKIEAVLTPDQKTKFDAEAAEHEKAWHDHQAGAAPAQ